MESLILNHEIIYYSLKTTKDFSLIATYLGKDIEQFCINTHCGRNENKYKPFKNN